MSSRVLDDGHWTNENYKQRISNKQWKEILLNRDDEFIAMGRLRQLKAKKLGFGIVEVFKKPLTNDMWSQS